MTDAERKLWRYLRLRQMDGYKFRRQHPIGAYIVDFVCLERHLVIEVDGGQHAERAVRDIERSSWLEAHGYLTLRFWNNQVIHETEAVLDSIRQALLAAIPSPLEGEGWDGGVDTQKYPPHLNPPPQGGRKLKI